MADQGVMLGLLGCKADVQYEYRGKCCPPVKDTLSYHIAPI